MKAESLKQMTQACRAAAGQCGVNTQDSCDVLETAADHSM